MMFNALVTQANSKLSMTKSVISGGHEYLWDYLIQ